MPRSPSPPKEAGFSRAPQPLPSTRGLETTASLLDTTALTVCRLLANPGLPPRHTIALTEFSRDETGFVTTSVRAALTVSRMANLWQKGAFAFTRPDECEWMWPATRRPEGPVHCAGEHTSVWFAWQNGALESAERCVDAIVSGSAASASL